MAGFPCVSISLLTTTPGSIVDQTCQSGRGYIAVENYIKKYSPPVAVLENVGSVFNCRQVEGGVSALLEDNITANLFVLNDGMMHFFWETF